MKTFAVILKILGHIWLWGVALSVVLGIIGLIRGAESWYEAWISVTETFSPFGPPLVYWTLG